MEVKESPMKRIQKLWQEQQQQLPPTVVDNEVTILNHFSIADCATNNNQLNKDSVVPSCNNDDDSDDDASISSQLSMADCITTDQQNKDSVVQSCSNDNATALDDADKTLQK